MKVSTYKSQLEANKDNQTAMGTLMGRAIKDIDVLPDQYTQLCLDAKAIGFKFQYIIFV